MLNKSGICFLPCRAKDLLAPPRSTAGFIVPDIIFRTEVFITSMYAIHAHSDYNFFFFFAAAL